MNETNGKIKWETIVLTAPGRKTPTLRRTIESVVAAGWSDLLISVDTRLPETLDDMQAILRYRNAGVRPGPWPHLLDAVRHSLVWRDWDSLLIVQDDISLAVGCRRWLETRAAWMTQSVALASLWLPAWHSDNSIPPHVLAACWPEIAWWMLKPEDLPRRAYGALAIVLSRDSATALSCWVGAAGSLSKADFWLGKWCKESGKSWLYPFRSLCQHEGEGDSTISNDHRSPLYRMADNPVTDCDSLQTLSNTL